VARDAIGVIVHPSNPVDHLTLKQVSDIYQGKINNWSEVGGEDRPIVRLSREFQFRYACILPGNRHSDGQFKK
jgi:phosphate transport system substrate-binding protein